MASRKTTRKNRCSICGQIGHIASYHGTKSKRMAWVQPYQAPAPKKPRGRPRTKPPTTQRMADRPRKPIQCSACGQIGHNAQAHNVAGPGGTLLSMPAFPQTVRAGHVQAAGKKGKGKSHCSVCGLPGHNASSHKAGAGPKTKRMKATKGKPTCSVCGQMGHNAASHKPGAGPKTQRPKGQKGKPTCGLCGQTGHNVKSHDLRTGLLKVKKPAGPMPTDVLAHKFMRTAEVLAARAPAVFDDIVGKMTRH